MARLIYEKFRVASAICPWGHPQEEAHYDQGA